MVPSESAEIQLLQPDPAPSIEIHHMFTQTRLDEFHSHLIQGQLSVHRWANEIDILSELLLGHSSDMFSVNSLDIVIAARLI